MKNKPLKIFLITSGITIVALATATAALFFNFENTNAAITSDPGQIMTETTIAPEQREVKIASNDIPLPVLQTPLPIPTVPPQNLPSKYNFNWDIFHINTTVKEIVRKDEIRFQNSFKYSSVEGVTCFRGNNYRDTASFGNPDIRNEKLEIAWNVNIGAIDNWTGVGWNGQPSIVKWSDELKQKMNMFTPKKQKQGLTEVIYAALDGKIYFLDLDDGEATRPVINIGYPLKGSVTIDPRGYPLLYSGQGIDEIIDKSEEKNAKNDSNEKNDSANVYKKVDIGYRIFNLINNELLFFLNGNDLFSHRLWGAFDSNGIIDANTDNLIVCGENGLFYTIKLNTLFDIKNSSITLTPEITKYRYMSPKNGTIGIENSVAIYKSNAYFADNSGTLQCIDLNSLTPVWIRDVTDDTDSTIAIEEEQNTSVFLYTACEVDKQSADGYSFIRKINALTGELVWEKKVKCIYNEDVNGGALASPVIGKNDIDNLVIYSIAKTSKTNEGKLIAFDKKTGNIVWSLNMQHYCWSSPVDVYSKDGKTYLIQSDSAGNMFLIDGRTGKILHSVNLSYSNVEGSPAVYGNMVVVGTRGQQIYGVEIN